uniref:CLASP N-terminal domain-containing protein n=1 Tax=Aegilops tauschii TaxID=37682 RepID=M8BMU0_AEGTA
MAPLHCSTMVLLLQPHGLLVTGCNHCGRSRCYGILLEHFLVKSAVTGQTSCLLGDEELLTRFVLQACHLLNVLSKELLSDFEACAEIFIPILRNCKVSRIVPLIADTAKNDRSAILRARCCEYALLILEYWADAPEIQRSADLYEDLIKCCVADAMSEVRATARSCYRMFIKTWPERSRRLFMSFDPAIQRITIYELSNL